ncbi:MAG: BamA/TamA family outer membrane protein [Bacteroidales bacterium]|nr:BamA/TamA family outer membrane protein [Bacteroidales bacterium]
MSFRLANITKYAVLLCVAALLLGANVFSQSVSVYSRLTENEKYMLDAKKRLNDSTSVDIYLEKYLSSKRKQLYIEAGFDSIAYGKKQIDAYATLGVPVGNVNVDVSESPIKIPRKKLSNPLCWQEITSRIIEYYSNRGYIFAEARFDRINIADNNFEAKLHIDKGTIVKVDSLIINGSAKITHTYIERVLELRKNSILTTDKIDKIDARIRNIPFLEQEQPFQLAFSDAKSDVLLFLKGKRASSFSGVLGIMPKSQTTGKVMITGDIDLSLVNVFHRGENFNFSWKKYETQNQTLNIGGAFPYIFRSPIGLGADFNLEKKDSSYLKTDFSGKVMVGNTAGKGFYLYYRNVSSFPIGDASEKSGNYTRFRTNLFGVGVNFSNVDNARNPYRGLTIDLKADAGKKNEVEQEGSKSLVHSSFGYDINGYIGFLEYLTIKLRNASSFIYSPTIFDNELMWVGGLNTIRGFDELSLPATYYTLGTIELRYLFERNSAVYVLTDAMYFGKMFTEETTSNYALGIGVGIDLNTPAGIFSLVYAIGKQNSNSFSFNNSKIHFGYKSYF